MPGGSPTAYLLWSVLATLVSACASLYTRVLIPPVPRLPPRPPLELRPVPLSQVEPLRQAARRLQAFHERASPASLPARPHPVAVHLSRHPQLSRLLWRRVHFYQVPGRCVRHPASRPPLTRW
jgi:hypothetical protein